MTRGGPKRNEIIAFWEFSWSHSTEAHKKLMCSGRTLSFMLSKDYIIGLTDGEGSFTAYLRPPDKKYGAKNYRIECHYYIKLRKEELGLLKEVKRFFNCGRISFQKDKRENHSDCYRFEISDLESIKKKVIPLFKKNAPKSFSRKKDFNLFLKIIGLVDKKSHQTAKGLKEIIRLKSQMHK